MSVLCILLVRRSFPRFSQNRHCTSTRHHPSPVYIGEIKSSASRDKVGFGNATLRQKSIRLGSDFFAFLEVCLNCWSGCLSCLFVSFWEWGVGDVEHSDCRVGKYRPKLERVGFVQRVPFRGVGGLAAVIIWERILEKRGSVHN